MEQVGTDGRGLSGQDERFVGLTDMELVALQYELRKSADDKETLTAVLVELGRRRKPVPDGEAATDDEHQRDMNHHP